MTKSSNLPTVFLAGCQKTASTWIYHCFKEHPEVFVPEKDALHFFTINHFRGLDWYAKLYEQAASNQVLVDPTPSYIRDPKAAQRIFEYNSDAKLIFSLRNPIDRAFSHYWHMKRKGLISYTFEDAVSYGGFGNIDLYQNWIQSGMYLEQLQPFIDLFPRDQLKVVLFEDLKTDPKAFIQEIFQFMDIEASFEPSVLHSKKNQASKKGKSKGFFNRKDQETEYDKGMPTAVRSELQQVFSLPNEQLGTWLNRDLSHWN